ncbi:hypothetical protein EVAR_60829_1 [Eumeta japonica]|uniref:Uncharacterized protein n=1 Tax=Eumeta variegata TaxID=151549 RepID=A0A4C1ZY92_EUMVA|nr:hypothetical protein EVAR_60829_1 [Eumeta japonica]
MELEGSDDETGSLEAPSLDLKSQSWLNYISGQFQIAIDFCFDVTRPWVLALNSAPHPVFNFYTLHKVTRLHLKNSLLRAQRGSFSYLLCPPTAALGQVRSRKSSYGALLWRARRERACATDAGAPRPPAPSKHFMCVIGHNNADAQFRPEGTGFISTTNTRPYRTFLIGDIGFERYRMHCRFERNRSSLGRNRTHDVLKTIEGYEETNTRSRIKFAKEYCMHRGRHRGRPQISNTQTTEITFSNWPGGEHRRGTDRRE